MLRRLSADDPRFHTIDFTVGLNLLIAETTAVSGDQDSRNGTGKSSMVELLHFLMGSRTDRRSLPMREAVRGTTFRLELDWPGAADGRVGVERCGGRPDVVRLSQNLAGAQGRSPRSAGTLFDVRPQGPFEVPVAQWAGMIEHALFGLPKEHPGLSGRTMLSFLMRRISNHAFNTATRTIPQQPMADATTNLAHLLGLDWKLASRYRELAGREAARRQLKKAVEDPAWGRVVGKAADLRGQITVAEEELRRVEQQVKAFRVVPQYDELKRTADDLDREIRDLNARDTVDRRNLSDLRDAVRDVPDTDVRYLGSVYREAGVLLGDQVRKRFDDVKEFHESVIRNRQRYLHDEMKAIEDRLADSATRRERVGAELQDVLRTLDEGGALDALTALQQALGQKRASLETLRSRYEAARALDASAMDIAADRLDVRRSLSRDLAERDRQTSEATVLFSEFAHQLYGTDRLAYLKFEAGDGHLRIEPHVERDDSRGIENMVIFCFDLTVAVIAHRHQNGPDFLVHDSHLFDGVDDRQVRDALDLAAEVADREGMQYIATLNSDDLDKARRRGFDPAGHLLAVRLTDAFEDGGLFGFRF